ncbi:MAG TPA: DUF1707 domain-containing protein [Pseudonocardiaceae bacterium]|nr:DUF1707 domain-containing protein [Pseudonocardiaceae bacterium]
MTADPEAANVTEADTTLRTGVRASHDEREAFAHTVSIASRDGRLSVTEADERLTKIYAATFREELPEFVADLPKETWSPDFTKPRPVNLVEAAPAEPARVWNGGLTVHAVIVGVLAIAAISAWRHSGMPFFWPAWPVGWLGVSVLVHYRFRQRRMRWRGNWNGGRPGDPTSPTMPGYDGPLSSHPGDRDERRAA